MIRHRKHATALILAVALSMLSVAGAGTPAWGSKGEATAQATVGTYPRSATLTLTGWEDFEGDSGSRTFYFTASIEGFIDYPFTATYRTRGEGEGDPNPPGPAATATPFVDYQTALGSFNLDFSGDSRTFSVEVYGDTQTEPDEYFYFEISSLHYLVFMKVTGSIIDDDSGTTVALEIDNTTVAEGNTGTTTAEFVVSVAPSAVTDVAVDYTTCGASCHPDATADEGGDYAGTSGTLTLEAGETSATVLVTVYGDTEVEPDETFHVVLSNPSGAVLADDTGVGTITDDDDSATGGTFSDDDGSIFETDIEWLAAQGITYGCNPPDNDLFCPTDEVTREQMAAFLVRALDLTEQLDNPFRDDDGSIFETDIEKLAAAHITLGCNPPDNDLFCPTDEVTREQMAAFLHRALE